MVCEFVLFKRGNGSTIKYLIYKIMYKGVVTDDTSFNISGNVTQNK